jgi:formiminotetrahydrofolate cyclodeaminase
MKEFKHLPISDYLGQAASDSPTPGGGSVASLVGALGAALGQMVYNLTHTKKSYLEHAFLPFQSRRLFLCRAKVQRVSLP